MERVKFAIKVIVREKDFVLTFYPSEYRNLMALIDDRLFPEDFGECKGIGRCGTCHVRVLNAPLGALMRIGNETSTLARMADVDETSRLACQVPVDEKLHGMIIEVQSECKH